LAADAAAAVATAAIAAEDDVKFLAVLRPETMSFRFDPDKEVDDNCWFWRDESVLMTLLPMFRLFLLPLPPLLLSWLLVLLPMNNAVSGFELAVEAF
jgi:hypothetical protein